MQSSVVQLCHGENPSWYNLFVICCKSRRLIKTDSQRKGNVLGKTKFKTDRTLGHFGGMKLNIRTVVSSGVSLTALRSTFTSVLSCELMVLSERVLHEYVRWWFWLVIYLLHIHWEHICSHRCTPYTLSMCVQVFNRVVLSWWSSVKVCVHKFMCVWEWLVVCVRARYGVYCLN